ncbi:ArsR/SmtB family transcription factor [Planktothrix tepida]|uniref:Transcriptional regulator, ArsR family n=2 Tax=Planktothrix TaxID=54304 RepID=A0A1J1LSX3_9CYAN|nr:Transcriptional regulator, ArsR family [Planktothrix tepida PCC 9214]
MADVGDFWIMAKPLIVSTAVPTPNPLIIGGFHALSDSLRLKVIELLRGQELCVCELCEQLNVPQSKLSFHLKILKEARLVRSRQDGRWIYYSLNCSQFRVLEAYLVQYQHLSSIITSHKSCD